MDKKIKNLLDKFGSIKFKLSFTILCIILCFGSLASASVFIITKNILLAKEKEIILAKTNAIANGALQFFLNYEKISRLIANRKELTTFLSNDQAIEDVDKGQLLEIFHQYDDEIEYLSIYLIDKNGLTLVSTDDSFIGQNYNFRNYFKIAAKGELATEVAVGATSKQLGYYFASPVINDYGQVLGVLVIKISPAKFNHSIGASTLFLNDSSGFNFYFLDSYGVVIYTNIDDLMFSSFIKTNDDLLNQQQLKERFQNFKIDNAVYSSCLDKVNEIKTTIITECWFNGGKEKSIAAFVPLQINNEKFTVVLDVNNKIIMEEIINITLVISFLVLVCAVTAFLIVYFSVSKILSPLTVLNTAIVRLRLGDYGYRISLRGNNEFTKLAAIFNKMAKDLNKKRELVEKEVKSRTEQLEKVNQTMVGRELKMIELKKELEQLRSKLKLQ